MASNALIFVVVLVLGCAGFLFGVIYVVFHAFGWLGRGVAGLARQTPSPSVDGPRRMVGSCAACGRAEERPGAQFCSQCGAGLRPIPSVEHNEQ